MKEDAGIVPLGVPMLAGAGAISTVMVLVGQVPTFWCWEMGAILGSITLTSLVSFLVLASADRVRQVMGETGIRILVRIMGLLLVALAMQLFINGMTDLGVLAAALALRMHGAERVQGMPKCAFPTDSGRLSTALELAFRSASWYSREVAARRNHV